MNPRWLSEVKARIGKCLMFGTNAEQTRFAGNILKEVGNDWKELVAGKEGYLINSKRAGLVGQKVVWGEMDTMVSLMLLLVDHVLYHSWDRDCGNCA
jgi:hypothetical protein